VPAATGEQLKTLIMGLPEDQIPGLDVSRERKEHYNAEIARLQALKEREELVPTADVKRMASTLGRQIRDNILSIPNRVAPLLAAAQDSGEVHRLLSEELRTALRVLADG
jgi:phage terminase Nu1 subunit (DNA packaging protein)